VSDVAFHSHLRHRRQSPESLGASQPLAVLTGPEHAPAEPWENL